MNKYCIIKDEESLIKFIDWLPELSINEKYYISLFARKKYDSRLKSDKSLIQRFVCDKSRMLEKIRRLELEKGSYTSNGIEVLEESLALYITINPRDLKKATYKSIKGFTELLEKDTNFDIHNEVLNNIQVCKSKLRYNIFDIDNKEFNLDLLNNIINKDCLTVLETRGGYHLLIKLDFIAEEYKKSYYQELSKLADQKGDLLSPIPGCTQGNFIPKFKEIC